MENYFDEFEAQLKLTCSQLFQHCASLIIGSKTEMELSGLEIAIWKINECSAQISSDLKNIYDKDGVERFKRRSKRYKSLLDYPEHYFYDMSKTSPAFKIKMYPAIEDRLFSPHFSVYGKTNYTITDLIIHLFEVTKSLKNEIYSLEMTFLEQVDQDFNLSLPNISNRVALLSQLGIIEHLQKKYPDALRHGPSKMIALLDLLLEIPAEHKNNFAATVKNLLNGNARTPETPKALERIQAQLSIIGIHI